MPTRPEDICNRAFDECGVTEIGDMFEGSPQSKAALRIYDPTLRQMFSGAHWNFARKQQQLILIGDACGQYNPNRDVPRPWAYMYDWPVDSVHARFILRRNVSALDNAGNPVAGGETAWNAPAPFIVSSAPLPNDFDSSWDRIEGHDPEQTRVILTNQLGAIHVYTGLLQYPDAWDPLFEQAMVAALCARLAMPMAAAKLMTRQEAIAIRRDNIQIAKSALDAARVRDGDEGWTVQDHTPDWIRARTSGPGWDGPGVLYYPWSSVPFLEDAGGTY